MSAPRATLCYTAISGIFEILSVFDIARYQYPSEYNGGKKEQPRQYGKNCSHQRFDAINPEQKKRGEYRECSNAKHQHQIAKS